MDIVIKCSCGNTAFCLKVKGSWSPWSVLKVQHGVRAVAIRREKQCGEAGSLEPQEERGVTPSGFLGEPR